MWGGRGGHSQNKGLRTTLVENDVTYVMSHKARGKGYHELKRK
jgi:hypothetical protein